jgi:hypothetical protein
LTHKSIKQLVIQNSKDDVLTVEILEQSDNGSRQSNQFTSIEKTEENSTPMTMKRPQIPTVNATAASVDVSSDEEETENAKPEQKQQVAGSKKQSIQFNNVKYQSSKGPLPSPLGSAHSFDLQVANWRMEKLEVDSKSGSEEEFYDCQGEPGDAIQTFTFYCSILISFGIFSLGLHVGWNFSSHVTRYSPPPK